jgi:hypothetical protein
MNFLHAIKKRPSSDRLLKDNEFRIQNPGKQQIFHGILLCPQNDHNVISE